jgi:hypothetical protein
MKLLKSLANRVRWHFRKTLSPCERAEFFSIAKSSGVPPDRAHLLHRRREFGKIFSLGGK